MVPCRSRTVLPPTRMIAQRDLDAVRVQLVINTYLDWRAHQIPDAHRWLRELAAPSSQQRGDTSTQIADAKVQRMQSLGTRSRSMRLPRSDLDSRVQMCRASLQIVLRPGSSQSDQRRGHIGFESAAGHCLGGVAGDRDRTCGFLEHAHWHDPVLCQRHPLVFECPPNL